MMEGRVLLVDDDEADVLFLTDALTRTNFPYPVVVARDGAKAIEMLENAASLPRLVILDLKMPKLGGLDVLKRLRASERLRGARVVILTGSAEQDDKRVAEKLGTLLFLRKPTDTSLYLDIARQIGVAALNGSGSL
jgi:two-component system response regulator